MNQNVNVVLRPSNRERNHFMVLTNPGQISPQSRLPLFRNGILAVLGAENQMDMIPGKRMCHSAAPSGLYLIALQVPPLSRWATIFRPWRDYHRLAKFWAMDFLE